MCEEQAWFFFNYYMHFEIVRALKYRCGWITQSLNHSQVTSLPHSNFKSNTQLRTWRIKQQKILFSILL